MAQRDEKTSLSRVLEAFVDYGVRGVDGDGVLEKRHYFGSVLSTAVECLAKPEPRLWSGDVRRAFSQQFRERIVPLMRWEDASRTDVADEDDWEFGAYIVNLLIVSLKLRPGFLDTDLDLFLDLLREYAPDIHQVMNVAVYDSGGGALIAVNPEEEDVAESMRELKASWLQRRQGPEYRRKRDELLAARLGYKCVLPEEGGVRTLVEFLLVLECHDGRDRREVLKERKQLFAFVCPGLSIDTLTPYAVDRAEQLTEGLRPYFLPEHFSTFRVEADVRSM